MKETSSSAVPARRRDRHVVRVVSLERFLWLLEKLARAPVRSELLAIFATHPGRIYTPGELACLLYTHSDGGPENAHNTIVQQILKLRRLGVPIRTHGKRGYSYGAVRTASSIN